MKINNKLIPIKLSTKSSYSHKFKENNSSFEITPSKISSGNGYSVRTNYCSIEDLKSLAMSLLIACAKEEKKNKGV